MLTEQGYQPGSVRLRRGVPARVTFLRKVEATCGTELLIPDYQIKRDLPFNEPVVIEFTPNKRGESEFSCGMKMLRGKIVVR
jgi:plastocyanin domain-containing protein